MAIDPQAYRERPFPCEDHPDSTIPLLRGHPDREVCVECWLELGEETLGSIVSAISGSALPGGVEEGKVPASSETGTGNE